MLWCKSYKETLHAAIGLRSPKSVFLVYSCYLCWLLHSYVYWQAYTTTRKTSDHKHFSCYIICFLERSQRNSLNNVEKFGLPYRWMRQKERKSMRFVRLTQMLAPALSKVKSCFLGFMDLSAMPVIGFDSCCSSRNIRECTGKEPHPFLYNWKGGNSNWENLHYIWKVCLCTLLRCFSIHHKRKRPLYRSAAKTSISKSHMW